MLFLGSEKRRGGLGRNLLQKDLGGKGNEHGEENVNQREELEDEIREELEEEIREELQEEVRKRLEEVEAELAGEVKEEQSEDFAEMERQCNDGGVYPLHSRYAFHNVLDKRSTSQRGEQFPRKSGRSKPRWNDGNAVHAPTQDQ